MSISEARANLPELIDRVESTMDRITITVNGQPKATLVSADELESLEETAEVLLIPHIKESIKKGMNQAKKGKGTRLADLDE